MAEEATQDAQEPQETEATQETDWKAEARKWETRAKENHGAVKERDSLTEQLEKLRGERDAFAEKVTAFEAEKERSGWAKEVAEAAGVPADVLRGDTKEALEAHAESLKALLSSSHRGPVIEAQGKQARVNVTDPNREAVKSLFGSKD